MRALIAFVAIVLMTASAAGQSSAARDFEGNLNSRDARATFEISLEAGQIVTLTTSSPTNLDTVLTLNGPDGRRVAENDDQQMGVLSSRIVHVPTSAGAYTAVVTGYNGATGSFSFNVSYGIDFGLSDAAQVVREETVSLDRRRTEARYPLELRDGDVFVASTFALTEGFDTTLSLANARGETVASNDDSGDGSLNSRLAYRVGETGRYELVASSYTGNAVGNFVLSMATDAEAQAPFNFAAIDGTQIAAHEGEINNDQTSHEYRIELGAGQTLMGIAEATSGNLDPVLRVNGPDGYPVALNDDRGDGSLNSAVAFTAQVAGAYTAVLSRYRDGESRGRFRLVLSSVDASVVAQLQAQFENQVAMSGPEQVIETQDFRVIYTTEGRDASTSDYAQATAAALQEVFDAQLRLGFAAPVRDSDGRYRAYIADALGNMGYTKPVQVVFDNPNTVNARETAAARGVFVIDNDFQGMGKKATPLSLMRATATHELNHMIQYGYDSEEGLQWLYESTASWVEVATVGADQDASGYVETDYEAPQRCWTTNERGHNYSQWTLLQSLADAHGDRIVVRLWENAVTYDGFETMSRTLGEVGTNIPDAIQRWRVQNFARDYDLAPLFDRSVALNGTISRLGAWSPRGRVEQLGAHYVALRADGPRNYALRGDSNLELVGLGRRNGEIEVVPLGRGGVFDAAAYEYAGLMVFNRAVPARPGACSGASYTINVAAASGAMGAPSYRFSAAHFAPPSN
jgi:hypothetical protein